ncbi:UNVERIFIED_CONTAM: hypothetical protein Sradi_6232800 [Sesamum radiatum]|uniref:Uncharacterized protein n=1 Tax=Sesamum radiatum TaxID=300843 RepID=A0AAW2K9Y5_SESRA
MGFPSPSLVLEKRSRHTFYPIQHSVGDLAAAHDVGHNGLEGCLIITTWPVCGSLLDDQLCVFLQILSLRPTKIALLDLPTTTGSPRYFSCLSTIGTPSIPASSFRQCCGVFLLKTTIDFPTLITSPDASSKHRKITEHSLSTSCGRLIENECIISEKQVQNTPTVDSPLILLFRSSSFTRLLKSSTQNKKEYEETGSP